MQGRGRAGEADGAARLSEDGRSVRRCCWGSRAWVCRATEALWWALSAVLIGATVQLLAAMAWRYDATAVKRLSVILKQWRQPTPQSGSRFLGFRPSHRRRCGGHGRQQRPVRGAQPRRLLAPSLGAPRGAVVVCPAVAPFDALVQKPRLSRRDLLHPVLLAVGPGSEARCEGRMREARGLCLSCPGRPLGRRIGES